MRRLTLVTLFLTVSLAFTADTLAQVDDVSEVTGLPIPIGAPIIYGQVMIKGFPKDQRRPMIVVYLRNRGVAVDKVQANDKGYFYFLKTPGDGFALAFEVDGVEVGTALITAGISNRVRQDVEFDWNALKGTSISKTGTVNVRDKYERSIDAEKRFDVAMTLVKEKRIPDAIKAFEDIVTTDAKDHVAWLMIGSLHFSEKRYNESKNAYETAIKLRPEYLLAHLNMGRLELSQKNYDPAIMHLLRSVEIEANSADANQLLGEAYLQAKKGSLAVGYLNRALEISPVEKADIHLRLAALYNAAGYKDRASLEYVAFLKKVKDHPDKEKFEQYIKDNPPKK